MTKIICRANNCIFWENKICTAEEIIYDPKEGCMTYEIIDDNFDDPWDEEHLLDGNDEDLTWDDDDVFFKDELETKNNKE
ncbi:DUF1540 domain-containing protein [Anaerolineales bacterium HSG25]|nr:DUF1540 domain-containing protein [Anaerolineales bacterium HSG25]